MVDGGSQVEGYRVQRFRDDGHLLEAWGSYDELGRPYGVTVTPQGSLFITNGATGEVMRFDYSG